MTCILTDLLKVSFFTQNSYPKIIFFNVKRNCIFDLLIGTKYILAL